MEKDLNEREKLELLEIQSELLKQAAFIIQQKHFYCTIMSADYKQSHMERQWSEDYKKICGII